QVGFPRAPKDEGGRADLRPRATRRVSNCEIANWPGRHARDRWLRAAQSISPNIAEGSGK
ncbi:MAG: hypothetical protein ACK52S_19820, partial [Pirellula sp.]